MLSSRNDGELPARGSNSFALVLIVCNGNGLIENIVTYMKKKDYFRSRFFGAARPARMENQ